MWLIMNNPGLLNSILFWSYSESTILSNGFSSLSLVSNSQLWDFCKAGHKTNLNCLKTVLSLTPLKDLVHHYLKCIEVRINGAWKQNSSALNELFVSLGKARRHHFHSGTCLKTNCNKLGTNKSRFFWNHGKLSVTKRIWEINITLKFPLSLGFIINSNS